MNFLIFCPSFLEELMKRWIFLAALCASIGLDAGIKLVEFKNESNLDFGETFCNGTPIQGAWLDQPETCMTEEQRDLRIVFEDAGRSGYHRPQWKFHVWLENDNGFRFLNRDRLLYAVIFYDGDGEVSLYLDEDQKLHVIGGANVKDILYPWAQGTMGRGNPYHEIQGTEIDENGIKYFDYNGFVGYRTNRFVDP